MGQAGQRCSVASSLRREICLCPPTQSRMYWVYFLSHSFFPFSFLAFFFPLDRKLRLETETENHNIKQNLQIIWQRSQNLNQILRSTKYCELCSKSNNINVHILLLYYLCLIVSVNTDLARNLLDPMRFAIKEVGMYFTWAGKWRNDILYAVSPCIGRKIVSYLLMLKIA